MDYLDCSVITKTILLLAFNGFCAITRSEHVVNNKISNYDYVFIISSCNYKSWIKIFQNFLSSEFNEECLVTDDCNYFFLKENNNLVLRHEKSNFIIKLNKNNIICLLRELSFLFVQTLCLPDSSKLCFVELLNYFCSLSNVPDGEKMIKQFGKKDFIFQFQLSIDLFNLNVSAVHIYCCLHKFKKDFFRLYKMRTLENEFK